MNYVTQAHRSMFGLPAADRPSPVDVAHRFVSQFHPDCDAAMVAGSVIRGQGTATSDLDVVILTKSNLAPFRESHVFLSWPIEAFVHTWESLHTFFESDARDRTPSLASMCLEGVVLRDSSGLCTMAKADARANIERGPEPLSAMECEARRYHVTDLLEDLAGARSFEEAMQIVPALAEASMDLLLAYHRKWSGKGKSLKLAIQALSPALADEYIGSLSEFYRKGDPSRIYTMCLGALQETGGVIFAGFRRP